MITSASDTPELWYYGSGDVVIIADFFARITLDTL